MDEFFRQIQGKKIHIVGVTGAEGSSILRLLVKHKIPDIVLHDFLGEQTVEKSFKLWHKGISLPERNRLYEQFQSDISQVTFLRGGNYLKNILKADLIFVPQSWRLYKDRNTLLYKAKAMHIPFYSLTRLYLDYARATVIGVTGTVGKGSVAYLITEYLRSAGKSVYMAGNETWMVQIADKLDSMTPRDYLVLEISHRQLQDGFTRAPHIAVFTNLYPNHLDEMSWDEYRHLKLSLIKSQVQGDITVLNHDDPVLVQTSRLLKSETSFFSVKDRNMNTKNIQSIYSRIMNKKSNHYQSNILAAMTVMDILQIPLDNVLNVISKISSLPARVEKIGNISGVEFYNDIKSTTPWATMAGLRKLAPNLILICGGDTKEIDYSTFFAEAKKYTKHIIALKSTLSREVEKHLPKQMYTISGELETAIQQAYKMSSKKSKILISPAAAFFYSKFIRGKKSIRKILTSLLPREQE